MRILTIAICSALFVLGSTAVGGDSERVETRGAVDAVRDPGIGNVVADTPVVEVPRTPTSPGISSPAFPYAEPEEAGLSSEKLNRLGDEIRHWVANGELVGAELLIVKDGRAVFHEAYGWSDLEERRPMERNSLFSIKSMSKPFTATAVLMLEEEGKLSLDDSVSRYIPTFTSESTTIRHLLTHTSGFTGTSRLGNPEYGYATLREAIEDWAVDGPTEPFGAFSYSDFTYGALGYIVEEVSGLPIDVFTEEKIIRPLGLDDTSTRFSPDSASIARLNPWYHWNEETGRYELRWSNARQPWPYYAAAWGLFSTAMDYAEFMSAWLDKGQYSGSRLLSPPSVEEALRPHAPTPIHAYGYGWFVKATPSAPGGMPFVFYHGGGDGTIALAYPAADAMVIFLTHSRGGSHLDALQNRLGRLEIFDVPGPYEPNMVWAADHDLIPTELGSNERDRYTGTFLTDTTGSDGAPVVAVRIWEAESRLHVRVGRVGERADWLSHLVPLGDDRFVLGRFRDDRLEAVDPIERFRVVVEDGQAEVFQGLSGDRVVFSAQRVR